LVIIFADFFIKKKDRDFLGKGKQVIWVGSKHASGVVYQLIKNGKWFMKLESVEVLREKLNG